MQRWKLPLVNLGNMKVTIFVDGIFREFSGDYHELHARDWNERLQDMLDTVHGEKNQG